MWEKSSRNRLPLHLFSRRAWNKNYLNFPNIEVDLSFAWFEIVEKYEEKGTLIRGYGSE